MQQLLAAIGPGALEVFCFSKALFRGFGVWGLGFGALGFEVWGLGFRVWGLGFRGLGFRVWGLGLRV